MRSEERLGRLLAAWREESLRPPRAEGRERARAAMRGALTAEAALRRSARPLPRRLGLPRPLLAGAALLVAGLVVVGVLGWNAPAGSPLFGVRAARQGIQLALPGADRASLHLAFAQADLGDARRGIDPAASLRDARAELAAARAELPGNRSSPLWTRYGEDVASLRNAEREIEGGSRAEPPEGPAPAAGGIASPSAEPAGGGTSPANGGDGAESGGGDG